MPPKKKNVKTNPLAFLDAHPFNQATIVDKIFGCIFGSALGDTIGLYTKFMTNAQSARIYQFEEGEWPKFQLVKPATKLHRDTHRYQLQLDFAKRLRVWVKQGLLALNRPGLGIGALVYRVVSDPEYLSDPSGVATRVWIEGDHKVAPNGSLMRTHTIGVIGIGLISCCILVGLIRGLLLGDISDATNLDDCIECTCKFVQSSPALMNPGNEDLPNETIDNRLHREDFDRYMYAKTLADLKLDEAGKIGYVYKCLGAAILLLRQAMEPHVSASFMLPLTSEAQFEQLTTHPVMEGGDADTNAAAACTLLGAYLRYARLPSHWTQGLDHMVWLQGKAARLVTACGVVRAEMNWEGDEAVLADGEWLETEKKKIDRVEGDQKTLGRRVRSRKRQKRRKRSRRMAQGKPSPQNWPAGAALFTYCRTQ
ncbi:ADP-ribosylation/Crystallin J1 [Phaeosphaeria sp. MPI-PUGE-AT-0046c]|nr:ADP-ribosylation/Crystallin J1 [Phaeosphaeria sp. MPI-PUGE-AT-0046c]